MPEIPTQQQQLPMPDNSAPSDMNIPIVLCKDKRSTIAHPIAYLVSYDRLTPHFINLLCLYLLYLNPKIIRKLLRILLGSRPWMRKWMLSFHRGHETWLLLLRDLTLVGANGYLQLSANLTVQ